VRERGLGVVATLGPGGTPQAAVVAVMATDLGEVVFGTERASRKFANIRRRPEVALAIGWDDDEIAVQCEGVADEPGGADGARCERCYLERFPDELPLLNDKQRVLIRVRLNWLRYNDPRPGSFRLEETELLREHRKLVLLRQQREQDDGVGPGQRRDRDRLAVR
jgi:Pyridoxamine 5'-phosphate oxidase